MKHRILNILALILLPTTSFATEGICPASLCAATQVEVDRSDAGALVRERGDALIREASRLEAAGNHADAGRAYLRAVPSFPEASGYLRLRAAREFVDAGEASIAEAIWAGSAAYSLPGSGYVAASIALGKSAPSPEVLEAALQAPDGDDVCETVMLEGMARHSKSFAVRDAFHAHCAGPRGPGKPNLEDSLAGEAKAAYLGHQPSTAARMTRAGRLYSAVRFVAAKAELDAIDLAKLSSDARCEYDFTLARTIYRLRQRDQAATLYEKVATTCKDEGLRVRSYYGWGKRRFETGKLDEARRAFTAIVTDFPHRTHADDAWLFLGRIAREKGEPDAGRSALESVLTKYRDGDMLFEVVWEFLEPRYRGGDLKGFLEAYQSLDLPEHDDQYFSQGRLEYFAGVASAGLKDSEAAGAYWQRAWKAYPFSFYGYLSNLKLRSVGLMPDPLVTPESGVPGWLDGNSEESTRTRAIQRFLRLGLFQHAADMARTPVGKSKDPTRDAWYAALASHLAGRYDFSHNLVRRTIPGRPWYSAEDSQQIQWQLAWPNPFGNQVNAAVAAESEQAGATIVRAALPSSIMREESSFIEGIESYAGALGLMQLMPRTALAHDDDIDGDATPARLKTAEVNVRVGVDHLYWLGRRFDGHPALIVAAYNAGAGAVGKWLKRQPNDDIGLFVEDIPYLQTRDYTKRVIGSYAAYQWLNGETNLDDRVIRGAR